MLLINLSSNAHELLLNANMVAHKSLNPIIHPIHLFISVLEGKHNVNAELKKLIINEVIDPFAGSHLSSIELTSNGSEFLDVDELNQVSISQSTKKVLIEAKKLAEQYEEHGQIFINEGHIIRAVFESDDKVTADYLANYNKDKVLSIIASPRDMIVYFNGSRKIIIDNVDGVIIRKVTESDADSIREFVLKNYYERWANTVEYGLKLKAIPIYIAVCDGNIVGFAGYNISKQRDGYFGPLGVLREYRGKKIGQALLESCLFEMEKLGYKSCIIGNASTFEFYEKACGAEIIPFKT